MTAAFYIDLSPVMLRKHCSRWRCKEC